MDEISKVFGTDKTKEAKGVWFPGPDGMSFLIARQGNPEFKRLSGELTKPHRRLIERGLADKDLLNEIAAEVCARTILLDWKKKDGKLPAYTPELGKQELLKTEDFFEFVTACSADARAYRNEELKAAEGN
jgi:hypothetical protein